MSREEIQQWLMIVRLLNGEDKQVVVCATEAQAKNMFRGMRAKFHFLEWEYGLTSEEEYQKIVNKIRKEGKYII